MIQPADSVTAAGRAGQGAVETLLFLFGCWVLVSIFYSYIWPIVRPWFIREDRD